MWAIPKPCSLPEHIRPGIPRQSNPSSPPRHATWETNRIWEDPGLLDLESLKRLRQPLNLKSQCMDADFFGLNDQVFTVCLASPLPEALA